MRFSRLIPAATAAAALAAVPAHAQQWGGPLFSSPLDHSRFEILASDANGAGMGIAVAVRPFARNADLRLRVGIMDGQGTGPFDTPEMRPGIGQRPVAYMAGLDYVIPLNPEAGGPLRASLVTGLGVGVNVGTLVSAPLGVSIAYDGGRIRPYMTPRISLEHHTPPKGRRLSSTPEELGGWRIRGAVDWGVDVDLPIGGTLRAAVTTGSYQAVGIGISF